MAATATAPELPLTARAYLGAWGEATVSFLDHLLALSLGLGLPALMIGVAGYNLLDADADFLGWLLFRGCGDLLTAPLCLAAGLWMSQRASFFRPSLGEVGLAVAGGESRILWAALFLAVVLYPALYPGVTLLLAVPLLMLSRPHRWLEGQGRLWGRGDWRALVGAAPLLLVAWPIHWFLLVWEVWSLEESTPLMLGLVQVTRVLLSCWGWTILFRLLRLEDGE